jgi:hypothetical protein
MDNNKFFTEIIKVINDNNKQVKLYKEQLTFKMLKKILFNEDDTVRGSFGG